MEVIDIFIALPVP